jgi:hypothetical protein
MKALVAGAAVSLISAASFGSPAAFVAPQTAASVEGTWTATMRDAWKNRDGERWISLQLQQSPRGQTGFSVPLTELQGLPAADERLSLQSARFSLRRDAGAIDFSGSFTEGLGAGTFVFAPNTEYVSAMRAKFPSLRDQDVFRMAVHDVSREFVAAIEREGYREADLADLVRMRVHNVDVDYIRGMRKAGYEKVSIEDLVRTRIHGATPQYVQAMSSAGYRGLSLQDLVRTRIHGATPEFVQEVKAAGFEKLDVDTLVRMRIHGSSRRCGTSATAISRSTISCACGSTAPRPRSSASFVSWGSRTFRSAMSSRCGSTASAPSSSRSCARSGTPT